MFQFLGFIYLMLKYGWTGRGEPASLQGVETDWLLNVNFVIIIAVFFITNFLLFTSLISMCVSQESKRLTIPTIINWNLFGPSFQQSF